MGKLIFDMSISLDGFMAAAGQRPDEPLGEGGERLHEWAFGGNERDRKVLTGALAGLGAVITGRRTCDDSVPFWGPNGPTGPARLPVFVVTHSVPDVAPEDGVYTFGTGGIELALEQATAAAAGKEVTVMGGPQSGRQYVRAGLVDELSIHLVPILFGAGTRMFDRLGDEHIELTDVVRGKSATHLGFRVIRREEEPQGPQTKESSAIKEPHFVSFEIEGAEMAVRLAGDRVTPALLLIHGLPVSRTRRPVRPEGVEPGRSIPRH